MKSIVTFVMGLTHVMASPVLAENDSDNLVGQWTIEYTARNQPSTATLLITTGDDGSLSGQWTSGRGTSEIDDLKFEDGRLTFVRRFTIQGRTMEMRFAGKVVDGKLTGEFDSSRGKTPANGARSDLTAPTQTDQNTAGQRPSGRRTGGPRGGNPRARTTEAEAPVSEPAPRIRLSGTVKTETITGPISKKEITFYVYLPAGYDKGDERYPVSIFLHGIGQSRGGVLPRGFAEGAFGFLDRAMRAGKIGPHIQIVP